MLYIPVSATTIDEHSISTNAGTAELTHKNDIGITLPVGEVTKVKNIESITSTMDRGRKRVLMELSYTAKAVPR